MNIGTTAWGTIGAAMVLSSLPILILYLIFSEQIENALTAGAILKELRAITDEYSVPEDGCETYDLTFELIQRLESDLFEHIHLENNILFKRFETAVV